MCSDLTKTLFLYLKPLVCMLDNVLFINENISYRTKRNKMEAFVVSNAGHFLKAISSPMVSFMLQSKINNILGY